jgi:hypothetical protein
MTLRHPKSIVLAGNRWTVEYDKSSQSGEYTATNRSIIIGTGGTDERTLAVILHELVEIQVAHLHCRYTDDYQASNDYVSFLFVMTHPQFQEALELVTPVLMEFLPKEMSSNLDSGILIRRRGE